MSVHSIGNLSLTSLRMLQRDDSSSSLLAAVFDGEDDDVEKFELEDLDEMAVRPVQNHSCCVGFRAQTAVW